MEFTGKVVLVTGGGRGIGRAISAAFARAGAAVAVGYRERGREAGAVVDGLRHGGRRAIAVQGDVGRAAEAKALIGQVLDEWGRLDVLVNNAGILRRTPLAELTLEEWDAAIAANLTGVMLCSQAAAPVLRARGGAIVNVASIRGLVGGTSLAYAASKGGVVTLTKTLARTLAPEVRVNAVAPAFVDTDLNVHLTVAQREQIAGQIPLGRFAEPEEIARAVVFLASPRAAYITGQTLVVDGGYTMW